MQSNLAIRIDNQLAMGCEYRAGNLPTCTLMSQTTLRLHPMG